MAESIVIQNRKKSKQTNKTKVLLLFQYTFQRIINSFYFVPIQNFGMFFQPKILDHPSPPNLLVINYH